MCHPCYGSVAIAVDLLVAAFECDLELVFHVASVPWSITIGYHVVREANPHIVTSWFFSVDFKILRLGKLGVVPFDDEPHVLTGSSHDLCLATNVFGQVHRKPPLFKLDRIEIVPNGAVGSLDADSIRELLATQIQLVELSLG